MKRAALAAVAAGVIACGAAPAPRAPVAAAPVTTARVAPPAARATFEEIPNGPLKLMAGRAPGVDSAHPDGTLLLFDEKDGAVVVEEMDAASHAIARTVSLGPGELADAQESSTRIYVLIDDAARDRHRLVALEPATLQKLAESTAPRRAPGGLVDHAQPAIVEPGARGVRVIFRSTCPQPAEDEDGCVFYETHALGDLRVMITRHYGFNRVWNVKRPVHVPDDQGAEDAPPAAAGPGWELDRAAGVLRAPDGRTAPCPVHGELLFGAEWVGPRLFVRTSGCCGGEHGGFYVCEVPR